MKLEPKIKIGQFITISRTDKPPGYDGAQGIFIGKNRILTELGEELEIGEISNIVPDHNLFLPTLKWVRTWREDNGLEANPKSKI